ncbi:hypothetical protein C2E23DRAFT_840469 [Lenzites betulinus]|nr:hypothetical protein C2E23DRAFT_840469 [Lenzites betulinus]
MQRNPQAMREYPTYIRDLRQRRADLPFRCSTGIPFMVSHSWPFSLVISLRLFTKFTPHSDNSPPISQRGDEAWAQP